MCGKETPGNVDGWMQIGGPIKGSILLTNENDKDITYDYISDFGMYVEDPCQAKDNLMNINSHP